MNARIGVGKQGFSRLTSHPWFTGLDWEKLSLKEIDPPFIPDVIIFIYNQFYFFLLQRTIE